MIGATSAVWLPRTGSRVPAVGQAMSSAHIDVKKTMSKRPSDGGERDNVDVVTASGWRRAWHGHAALSSVETHVETYVETLRLLWRRLQLDGNQH